MSELGPGFGLFVGRETGEKGLGGGEFAFGRRAGENELVNVGDGGLPGEKSFGGEL